MKIKEFFTDFNSIKVRLEHWKITPSQDKNANFNSIKVRLEQTERVNNNKSRLFQFHKGAIRTGYAQFENVDLNNFNSIKVRLEHKEVSYHLTSACYFNSIKVRLEQQNHIKPYSQYKFQFHKGAIRTPFSLGLLKYLR